MNKEEFEQKRKKEGLLLNQLEMIKHGDFNYLRKSGYPLWFIEFPDESWLREDKLDYTNNAQYAYCFFTKEQAELFIHSFDLDRFGAFPTEHVFMNNSD